MTGHARPEYAYVKPAKNHPWQRDITALQGKGSRISYPSRTKTLFSAIDSLSDSNARFFLHLLEIFILLLNVIYMRERQ